MKERKLLSVISLMVLYDCLSYVMYYLDKINNMHFKETKRRDSKFLKLRKTYLRRDFHDGCEYWSSVLFVQILWQAKKLRVIHLTWDPTHSDKIKLKGEHIP